MKLLTENENKLIRCFPGFAIPPYEIKPYDENELPKDLDMSQQFYNVSKYEFLALVCHTLIHKTPDEKIAVFLGSAEYLRECLEMFSGTIETLKTVTEAYDYYASVYAYELNYE